MSDKARATASTHAPLSIASARATVNPGASGSGSGSGGSRGLVTPTVATVLLIVGGLIGAAVVVPNFVSRSQTVQPTPTSALQNHPAAPAPSPLPAVRSPIVPAPQTPQTPQTAPADALATAGEKEFLDAVTRSFDLVSQALRADVRSHVARANAKQPKTMERFERTRLWRECLAERPDDPHREDRELLRGTYRSFRAKATLLVGEIARSLPSLTVHDVTHLDALWEMADLIAGPELKLTPAEAFVWGGAVLLHDAGMALAASPEGLTDLRRTTAWQDSAARRLREELGRAPSAEEVTRAGGAVAEAATQDALRSLHAERAQELPSAVWSAGGESHRLIEETYLRENFGPLIGRLAHSHWWPQAARRVGHEVGHCHLAAGQEGRESGQQAEHNQQAADQLDGSGQHHHRRQRPSGAARPSSREVQQLLAAV